jgi:hypothetical protein
LFVWALGGGGGGPPHDPAARARAGETARELQALSQRLHAALVRAGLRATLGR